VRVAGRRLPCSANVTGPRGRKATRSEVVAYSPKPARAPMAIRPPRSTGRRAPLLPRAPTPVAGARVVSSSTCSSFDAPLCRPSARKTQETERTRWSYCGAAEVELGADG
jgi:hypothetical protein